jgi:hypothetical protein
MRRFWVWLLVALTLASATAAPAQIVGGVPLPLLQGPSGCDPRATLELDYSTNLFCSNGQKAGSAAAAISGFSYSRTGTEYAQTSSGLLVPFGSGVPAITDLGLQVWEARTNAIRNNSMVGAAVAGSLPTNWVPATASGLAWSVAGLGTELGIPYIDLRLSGTAVGAGTSTVRFDAVSAASASASQAWTASTYSKLAAGSATNVSQNIMVGGTSTDGVTIIGSFALPALSLTNTLTRVSGSGTTGASTTNVVSYIQIGTTAGAVDITIRLAGMGLEQASFAGPVILTSGSSATRGAASASVTGALPPSFLVDATTGPSLPPSGSFQDFVDYAGTTGNAVTVYIDGTTGHAFLLINNSSVQQASLDLGAVTANTRYKLAVRLATNDVAASLNGGALKTAASVSLPTVTRRGIAGSAVSGNTLNGLVGRLVESASAWSNAQLQSMSQ